MPKVEPQIFQSKEFKALKEAADKSFNELPEIMRMFIDLQQKVIKRCMLEGCRFANTAFDKPEQQCIYCGTPQYVTDFWETERGK